jgi:hypothetical protein
MGEIRPLRHVLCRQDSFAIRCSSGFPSLAVAGRSASVGAGDGAARPDPAEMALDLEPWSVF